MQERLRNDSKILAAPFSFARAKCSFCFKLGNNWCLQSEKHVRNREKLIFQQFRQHSNPRFYSEKELFILIVELSQIDPAFPLFVFH